MLPREPGSPRTNGPLQQRLSTSRSGVRSRVCSAIRSVWRAAKWCIGWQDATIGQDIIEYSLLAAMLALGAVAAVAAFGDMVDAVWQVLGSDLRIALGVGG